MLRRQSGFQKSGNLLVLTVVCQVDDQKALSLLAFTASPFRSFLVISFKHDAVKQSGYASMNGLNFLMDLNTRSS